MDVIYLQIFVSLTLVVGSLLMFAFSTRKGDAEHADRLALRPIDAEGERVVPARRPTEDHE